MLVDVCQDKRNPRGGWAQGIAPACFIPHFLEHNKSMAGYINLSLMFLHLHHKAPRQVSTGVIL